VTHHDARYAGPNGDSECAQLCPSKDSSNVRCVVGRDGRRAEAGKVLGAGPRATGSEPPGEGDSKAWPVEMPRAEWAVAKIDNWGEIELHPGRT
jgi:hypothetical protein